MDKKKQRYFSGSVDFALINCVNFNYDDRM